MGQRTDNYRKSTLWSIALDAMVRADGKELKAPNEANLMVAAWQTHPQRLGLPGFKECFPDTKQLYVILLTLKKKNLIHRYAECSWELTPTGRMWVRELREGKS